MIMILEPTCGRAVFPRISGIEWPAYEEYIFYAYLVVIQRL
jgi:hypothetical protein